MSSRAIEDLAKAEITALHDFFVAWFGRVPAPDFACCENALADDFRMIAPDGSVCSRAEVMDGLRRARLSRPPDFSIQIGDVHALWQTADAILVEYTERQKFGSESSIRRSTALLTRSPDAPGGVQWRHLQETWMRPERKDDLIQAERGREA